MRLREKLSRERAQREAEFLLNNPKAFRQPDPVVQPMGTDLPVKPVPAPLWGPADGSGDVGHG